ncbi:MAG: flippase-like domain-containing protein [Thermoguttaceae bacterium]|nr:flippase-like domain-containing protein [Thermoguttaceae bacterium]MDW8037998.1 lysylphosphatidylglycerol synthase transmembrane domain-containing protein [Thermoguttaceae bacterium]
MNTSWPTPRKWLLPVVKFLVLLLVLWFVRKTLQEGWEELQQGHWRLRWGWLVLSGGVYLFGLLGPALFWYQVLHRLGQKPHLAESLRAYYISHLGKYVPGKAMVILLRAGLIFGQRVQLAMAAVSTFIETLTMMAVGAFLALAILLAQFREHPWLMLSALGLMVVSGLPTLPWVVRFILGWLRWPQNGRTIQEAVGQYRLSTMLLGWVYMAFCWAVLGLSLGCCLQGMGVQAHGDHPNQWALWTATVALAVVAGFVSLVPGGLMVREAVLLSLLAPQVGKAAALASAVLLRLVWLVAELAISAILYGSYWYGRIGRTSSEETSFSKE